LRRVPDDRVWGTEEEPIAWRELTWKNRLEILYTLCEWQFQTPLKVRQAMKDDSDDGSWVSGHLLKFDTVLIYLDQRSAPIGRDAQKNTYWHLGRAYLVIRHPLCSSR
jgi:hypothetical protein